MTSHRYQLQPYTGPASRYPCPACERRGEFVRYVDTHTGEYLNEAVGRCNRESTCRYHYRPAQYFQEHPPRSSGGTLSASAQWLAPRSAKAVSVAQALPSFHPSDLVTASLKGYEHNAFAQFLALLFGNEAAQAALRRYQIGSSRHWPGACVFWQIDALGRVRAGKVMAYEAQTGKRLKRQHADGSERPLISWVHTLLKEKDFRLQQCLFGEHLLEGRPVSEPVAIVESEKTAVLGSVYLPAYTWLATGGSSGVGLTEPGTLRALAGRKVTLFPDVGAFEKWQTKAWQMEGVLKQTVHVSALLEARDRPANWDLADEFLSWRKPLTLSNGRVVNWALTGPEGYPAYWDYVIQETLQPSGTSRCTTLI